MLRVERFLIRVCGIALVSSLACGEVFSRDLDAWVARQSKHGDSVSSIQPFTLVAIPDTQILTFSPNWNQGLVDQTSWIRQNVLVENIKFVTHLGDVVSGEIGGLENLPGLGWADQWERSDAAMAELDAINEADGVVLPYSVSLGNHDLLPRGDKLNGADPIPGGAFRTFFGATRYEAYQIHGDNPYQWYGGSDITEWNHYQIFQAGPYTYLHLNLELDPENTENDLGIPRTVGVDDALAWAQSVIDAHPGIPTIISTHKLITDDEGTNDLIGFWGDGIDDFFGGQRTPTGQIVWDSLVRSNPQVFMTINGHDHEGPYRQDGEYHQVSTNDVGLSVFEILVNHQDYVNPLTGNDPYLRLIEFDPRKGQIRNKTFSPTFAKFTADPNTVEATFEGLLDAFELGLPLPIFSGEDLLGAIAPFPLFPGDVAHTREEAANVILSFFGASSIDELNSVDFSPFLTDADSQFSFDVGFDSDGRPTVAVLVPVDILPFRCPNTLKTGRGNPFVAVAILGTSELAASQVDRSSIRLDGIAPIRPSILRDVGTPFFPLVGKDDALDCNVDGRDGRKDLLVFFRRAQVLRALGDVTQGEVRVLRLTGKLEREYGSAPIVGEDVIVTK